jgi:hypothetical protein
MSRNVQGHAIYQAIILLIVLFAGPKFLLDYPYEQQCLVYDKDGECDTSTLNPYYTTTEYYEPEIWSAFTDEDKQHMVKGKKNLKPGMKFDEKLLYSWQCNLFT